MVKTDKQVLLTKDGLKQLELELQELKDVRRKEVAAKLKEAIAYGDLSENAEYDAAKNEQAFVEGRIMEIEQMIDNAKIISAKKGSAKVVQFGSKVEVKDLNKAKAEIEVYTLVGSTEADPFAGKISNESPLGAALLESKVGDEVEFDAPKGKMKYKIMKLA